MTGDFLFPDAEIKIFIFFLMFIKLSSPIVISPGAFSCRSESSNKNMVGLASGENMGL